MNYINNLSKGRSVGFLLGEKSSWFKSPAFFLSEGQQQRLCISRTWAVKFTIILLDEPCSALDSISTSKIEKLIMDLKKLYYINCNA